MIAIIFCVFIVLVGIWMLGKIFKKMKMEIDPEFADMISQLLRKYWRCLFVYITTLIIVAWVVTSGECDEKYNDACIRKEGDYPITILCVLMPLIEVIIFFAISIGAISNNSFIYTIFVNDNTNGYF